MKNCTLLLASLVFFLMAQSACSEIQPESEPNMESYLSAFHFEYDDSPPHGLYVPVVHNSISKKEFVQKVRGQGWKTKAAYQLSFDKEILKEFVLLTEGPASSAKNEIFFNYLIFSEDRKSYSSYDLLSGWYTTDSFTYDETNNALTLRLFVSPPVGGGLRRLVYLSSETMVFISISMSGNYDVEGERYCLEILERVSASERHSWVKQCPHKITGWI